MQKLAQVEQKLSFNQCFISTCCRVIGQIGIILQASKLMTLLLCICNDYSFLKKLSIVVVTEINYNFVPVTGNCNSSHFECTSLLLKGCSSIGSACECLSRVKSAYDARNEASTWWIYLCNRVLTWCKLGTFYSIRNHEFLTLWINPPTSFCTDASALVISGWRV